MRTVIARRRHHGPLVIQKPFYPEGGVCHVYILHPPGGIVGGDELSLNLFCKNQSHALVTTPAANKLYKSPGATALVSQNLTVEPHATLEWLPQETIAFSGAHARTLTRVDVSNDARFIGWEITCLGRPASHERFDRGRIRQNIELWKNGKPLFIDRADFLGDDDILKANWGLRGHSVNATMTAYPADNGILNGIRSSLESQRIDNTLTGATLMNDLLVCRYLGDHSEHAKAVFETLWSEIRPSMMQRPACPPRIWMT
jgi:urease accessory protein